MKLQVEKSSVFVYNVLYDCDYCTLRRGHDMNDNNNQVWRMLYLILQIGITMLTSIFLCIGIAWLIKKVFGVDLMIWFIILGVVASFRAAYILIKKFIDI